MIQLIGSFVRRCCRKIRSQQRRHRYYFYCFVVLTFLWTTAWIISFHQSALIANSYYNIDYTEDFSLIPPISSTSLVLWNIVAQYDKFGAMPITPGTGRDTTNDFPPYITDILCSGCRHSIADPNVPNSERCGYYIDQHYRRHQSLQAPDGNETNMDLIISVIGDMIAHQFPKGCSKCQGRQHHSRNSIGKNTTATIEHNGMCSNNRYQYWRYDSVAPVIRSSVTQNQWFPSSKPKQFHFAATTIMSSSPASNTGILHTNNETSFYYRYFDTNLQILPKSDEFFMEYNPSIVILPKGQYKALQFTSLSHDYYVISFRVSNQNYCFHPKDRQQQALLRHQVLNSSDPIVSSISKDYLGIIIVNASSSNFPNVISNKDVDIVYDTIVDLKEIRGFGSNAQDFRLFVLQKQLYISSVDSITPIWFTSATTNAPPNHSRKDTILVPTVFSNATEPQQLKLNVWVRKSLSCVNCHRKRAFCGKNFNYFVDEDMTNRSSPATVRVEIWPTGPRTVSSVDLNKPCRRGLNPAVKYFGNTSEVLPSFPTMEEVDFPALRGMESIFTRGRGSACCVPMQYPSAKNDSSRTVLVGIQHTKTPSQRNRILPPNVTSNHYLSSFYAFESTPPYSVIARSGWFCLGFPNDPNEKETTNISLLHHVTAWRKLVLGGRTYNCPRIHFVSGMTIKVNDPNSVILAYGINDCYSRFVEIHLSDIYDLLFNGPSV